MTEDRSNENTGEGKDLGNFHGMLHTALASHFRAGRSRYSKTKYDPLNAFLPGHLAAWIPNVVRYGSGRNTPSAITLRPAKALAFFRLLIERP